MGISELFEIGFFSAFWNWSNPFLTLLVYSFVILGAIIQFILTKKCQKPILKWLLIAVCCVLFVICEGSLQVISGWDRLMVDVVYGFGICLFIGAIITTSVSLIKNRP